MRAAVGLLLLTGCQLVFPLEQECPADYEQIGSARYALRTDTPKAWPMANAACAIEGEGLLQFTHLAVISDARELEAVIASGRLTDDTWIGLSDRATEGTFEWVSTEVIEPAYPAVDHEPPWNGNEPNNNTGGEDCVVAESDGEFNDLDCPLQRSYLCECDAFPSRDDP